MQPIAGYIGIPGTPIAARPTEYAAFLRDKQERCQRMCNEFKYAMEELSVGWGGFTNAAARYLNIETEYSLEVLAKGGDMATEAPPAPPTMEDFIKAQEELSTVEAQLEKMKSSLMVEELPEAVREMWGILVIPEIEKKVEWMRARRDGMQRAIEEAEAPAPAAAGELKTEEQK